MLCSHHVDIVLVKSFLNDKDATPNYYFEGYTC